MSYPVCRICNEESELSYKCSRCGKPFDGNGDSGGNRAVIGGDGR